MADFYWTTNPLGCIDRCRSPKYFRSRNSNNRYGFKLFFYFLFFKKEIDKINRRKTGDERTATRRLTSNESNLGYNATWQTLLRINISRSKNHKSGWLDTKFE